MSNFHVGNLRCEHLTHPLGLDTLRPRFSWELTSDSRGTFQSAWQIRVALSMEDLEKGSIVWDSGKRPADTTFGIEYAGQSLVSQTRYYWSVTAWNERNGRATSSASWWETGLLNREDWKARWIEPRQNPVYFDALPEGEPLFGKKKESQDYRLLYPCQMIRRSFTLGKPIRKARIYATAHGVYRLFVNGERVGDIELAPDYTSYEKLLQYQTYDVTPDVAIGENTIGAIVADGWWAGRVLQNGESCQYGDKLGLLLQFECEHEDGQRVVVASDESFTSSTGPLVYSDLCIGERYDARLEKTGWSTARYSAAGWVPVDCADYPLENIVAQYADPVRAVREVPAVAVIRTPRGETVVDFGQVLAGRVRMRVEAPAGTVIDLEHSEILDEEGNFVNNIMARNKDQRDFFVCAGGGVETYEPWFTFHGFRYVLVRGWPGQPSAGDFTAVVLSSDKPVIYEFECSDPRVNRLQKNIEWSAITNTLSIPTDCPQRERQGWTGDIQIFAPTANFMMDMDAFLTRWMRQLRAEQGADGQVPNIVPLMKGNKGPLKLPGVPPMSAGSAGWGDAVYIVPWSLYQSYGDRRVLEENYDSMKAWLAFQERAARSEHPEGYERFDDDRKRYDAYLWNTGFHFGDWAVPSVTERRNGEDAVGGLLESALLTKDAVAPCFFAYSTLRISQIARVLGRQADAEYFENLNANIKKAYAAVYVDSEGHLKTEFQGVYVLALYLDLIPDDLKPKAVRRLVQMIETNGWRLDTGFVSVPFLLDVLTQNGFKDVAYRVFFQNRCPSWLFEVEQGATSIWETWNAVQPDGTLSYVSFNHYAFGCVGDWMFRELAGLQGVAPGFTRLHICPALDSGLNWARARTRTMNGTAEVDWRIEGDDVSLDMTVPCNSMATVCFESPADQIEEGGIALKDLKFARCIQAEDGMTKVGIGSGTYAFRYPVPHSVKIGRTNGE